MAEPTREMIHIDQALTNISVAYIQKASSFVAAQVFPVVPVQKQSDRYFVYLKEDWFRDEATERAPATESAGGGYEIDNTPNYFCRKYGYHKDVTPEDRANSDTPLSADTDASDFVTQKMLLRREIVWANQYFTDGVWTTDLAGVAAGPAGGQFLRWDVAGSTPIEDIEDEQTNIASITGLRPNVLVLGARVYSALKNHDDILGRIVFTQRGIVTPDILAALFDVEKVVIAWAVRNIAAKDAAEDTDFLLGNHALLAYAAPRPALKTPSAGYIFTWTGLLGAGAYGTRMLRLPMNHLGLGTERIESELAFDPQVVAADLGCFFEDAVS